MKTQFLLTLIVFITTQELKATDTTPPVITLNGANPVYQVLNSSYTDAGATAFDDHDGDLTDSIHINNPVDVNIIGTYMVVYSVSDSSGNQATVTRTVVVYNEAQYLLCGNFLGTDSCPFSGNYTYPLSITVSANLNKRIVVQNFGAFGTSVYISLDVSGTSVGSTFSWPAQPLVGAATLLSSANGGSVVSLSPATISLIYQWTDGTASESCSSTYTGDCFTGISDHDNRNSFSIFPNPFSETTTINTRTKYTDAVLTIYNLSGQQVKQIKNISEQNIALHRDNLPSGIYFIRLTKENGDFNSAKLIIVD